MYYSKLSPSSTDPVITAPSTITLVMSTATTSTTPTVPPAPVVPPAPISSVPIEQRIEVVYTFLKLLYSATDIPSTTTTTMPLAGTASPRWVDCCTADVVHRTPVSTHKDNQVEQTSSSYADYTEGKGGTDVLVYYY
jgi:hypothetical protein